MFVVKFKIS